METVSDNQSTFFHISFISACMYNILKGALHVTYMKWQQITQK